LTSTQGAAIPPGQPPPPRPAIGQDECKPERKGPLTCRKGARRRGEPPMAICPCPPTLVVQIGAMGDERQALTRPARRRTLRVPTGRWGYVGREPDLPRTTEARDPFWHRDADGTAIAAYPTGGKTKALRRDKQGRADSDEAAAVGGFAVQARNWAASNHAPTLRVARVCGAGSP